MVQIQVATSCSLLVGPRTEAMPDPPRRLSSALQLTETGDI